MLFKGLILHGISKVLYHKGRVEQDEDALRQHGEQPECREPSIKALLSQLDFFKATYPVTTLSRLPGVSAIPQVS